MRQPSAAFTTWEGAWTRPERDGAVVDPARCAAIDVARTDRGDTVRLDVDDCGSLLFQASPSDWFALDVTIDELTG